MSPHPVIFFDPRFVTHVIAGWVLTLAGVGLLLVAAAWWSWRSDASQQSPRSGLWRLVSFAGWACFVGGLVWQFVGYGRYGILVWAAR